MGKMKWSTLLSTKRFNDDALKLDTNETRSPYERDYLRVLYSNQFRRLSDKTQVFTAPNNSVIHNRLTHTLEVSSIGKSLARMVVLKLFEGKILDINDLLPEELTDWYKKVYKNICSIDGDKLDSISVKNLFMNSVIDIVGTACLAHDIGNTPFGHAGESAISDSIKKYEQQLNKIDKTLYDDLLNFDGNSYGLRLLLSRSSLQLTYASIGAFIKYPITNKDKEVKDKEVKEKEVKKKEVIYKKVGIFSSEEKQVDSILETLFDTEKSKKWYRHPLAFLMEAADDIGYVVMDFEDAVRAKIINVSDPIDKDNNTTVMDLLYNSLECPQQKTLNEKYPQIKTMKQNKWISFKNDSKSRDILASIRAYFITNLITHARDQFVENYDRIMDGSHTKSLMACDNSSEGLMLNFYKLKKFSREYIYAHRAELLLEGSGYAIIENLLDNFLGAELSSNKTKKQAHALKILKEECTTYKDENNNKDKVLAIVGFVAGMTDKYAIELFQRINGHVFHGVE